MEKRIENIQKMEEILESHTKELEKLNQALDEFEKSLEREQELDHYYTDGGYSEDVTAYEEGKIPKEVRCGVLSEDLVYDMFGENYNLALRLMELGLAMIKRN